MYIRNFYLTSPLLILGSLITVVVANIPPSGYQSPELSYTYEEQTEAVRLVNEIAEEVKKWVLPDQNAYLPPSSGPQPETVKVKIAACKPVTGYITKRISQNVVVRTHCMQKSVYRYPNKRELMHQSSQCRGQICNPQPLSDPYTSEPTFLQLPSSMGSNPLASIFSNIMNDYNDYPENLDYTLPDYSYNAEPDPSAVDVIEYPAYDYYDENNRQQRSQTYPAKHSGDFLVKGKLLHSDKNVDISDPNFGLPEILFKLDRPKQLDFHDQLSNSVPKQYDYIDQPIDDKLNQVYSALADDYTIDYVYEKPIGDNNFRSAISDVYGTPVDDSSFRSAISDSFQDPILLSNNPPTTFSNVAFDSPTFLLQYHPNYVIPPGSKGLDLSHNLHVSLSGAGNIPNLSTSLNVQNNGNQGIHSLNPVSTVPNANTGVGIPIPKIENSIPNTSVNGGLPQSQDFGVPRMQVGIPIPKLDNVVQNNGVNQGFPQSQGSIAPNNPQVGVNNPGSQVGIPIPKFDQSISNNGVNQGFPQSQGSIAPNNPQVGLNNLGSQVGIPIPKLDNAVPNNGVNQGFPLSQGSIAPNNPQIGNNNPGSQFGIPIPKLENAVPNNGVNQGFPLSQGSIAPNNPQISNNNPASQVGIAIPKFDNAVQNNGVNQGFPSSQGSVAPNNPQIANNNPGSQVGIAIPKFDNPVPNNGVNQGFLSSQGSVAPNNPQISNNNPGSQVGIAIPKFDNPIPNNPKFDHPHLNHGVNSGIPTSKDLVVPTNNQIGNPNPNLKVGISIPTLDQPISNSGLNGDISLSQGFTIPIDSQISIRNSNPGVGIPIPNNGVHGDLSLSQGLTVPIDSQIAIPNSNSGFGIPLPSGNNPTPNNAVNSGIHLFQGPTVPVDALINIIKLHNPDLQIGIPITSQTIGVNGGVPLHQGSTRSLDSQIANPNSGLGVGISLPGGEQPFQNIDKMLGMPALGIGIPLPSKGNPRLKSIVSINTPISNNVANQGISMLNEAIIIVDSQGTINNADTPLGIPLPGRDIPGANNGINAGIPISNNGPNVGIPIPNNEVNLNNPFSNNGVSVGLPIINNDVNVGIPLPQNSATQNIVNKAAPGVGIPIPTADNPASNNDVGVGIALSKSENTLEKYPYGYPNQVPNIATITQLNLSPIPLDFLKSSSNTGYSPSSHGKSSPSYSNPFNVKFSPSQNNYVAKVSASYRGPIPEHT